MTDRLVLFMYQSWLNLDAEIRGLSPEELTTRYDGGSSIAWTIGHVTNMLDSWINGRFQGLATNPIISDSNFRTGGDGEARDWQSLEAAVHEVRQSARRFLDDLPSAELERVTPYTGSIEFLQPIGLRLSYAIMRITAHHFMHVGEIGAIRTRLGRVEDPPGQMWAPTLA